MVGPREVFERFQRDVLSGVPEDPDGHGIAEDVVVEWPFNPPGRPRRIEGRAAYLALQRAGRAALPVKFHEFREVVIHETADPEVIVAEYEMVGTVLASGVTASAPFVMVLRVRDGQVVHCREYQDIPAMTAAMG